jgi:hypothetical protein
MKINRRDYLAGVALNAMLTGDRWKDTSVEEIIAYSTDIAIEVEGVLNRIKEEQSKNQPNAIGKKEPRLTDCGFRRWLKWHHGWLTYSEQGEV